MAQPDWLIMAMKLLNRTTRFHRLKGAPLSISPLFVQRDDQVKGLFHLLSLALRLMTLIEFVVRRQLQSEQTT
ncbi:MAG: hypothetical protein SFW36_08160, partial [Leptolyngbyaceae cyanobacterium bins.59]|nr:hypothetical protein [Leptolyngbyaceae cyanobacterium bins.59]